MQNNNRGGFRRQNRGPKRQFVSRKSQPNFSRPMGHKNGQQFFNPEELCRNSQSLATETTNFCAQKPVKINNRFEDFKLAEEIFNNLRKNNYELPMPIQDQTIPLIMTGKDVIGIANTGTGKTAAFLLPLINKVFNDKNRSQKVLIVSPTRELAFQIRNEFEKFADRLGLRSILAIGGVNITHQIKQLGKPFDFIIGTPGRIIDLSNQKKLNLGGFKNIVLDEVDQMLDMGFIHDVRRIIALLATERQSLFFSATMDRKTEEIAQSFLTRPVIIDVKIKETSQNVEQKIVKLKGRTKRDILNEILRAERCQKTLVFARTKHGADKVARNLTDQGFRVGAIHGNKTQNYRLKMLDLFKKDQIQILVATDVASRGLDIKNISHVINYDLPASKEDYIHRIGRTGRAEERGMAISLIE